MYQLYILSAFSTFTEKADSYLLPCPLKYFSGFDCPGCGFQRSLLALFRGDFQYSFDLYPPTVPILLTFIICLSAHYFRIQGSDKLIKTLVVITGTLILLSYGYKVFVPHPVTAISRKFLHEAEGNSRFVDIFDGMRERHHDCNG